MRARLIGPAARLLIWNATLAGAQSSPALGPKDGTGLPPTDLTRIAVGGSAPHFTLESKDGAIVTLSSYRGRKNVVLVFNRGQW